MEEDNLRDREYLRSKFQNGDRPDEGDFDDFINGTINQKSDGIYAINRKVGIGTEQPTAALEVTGARKKVKQSFLTSDGHHSSFRVAHPKQGTVGIGSSDGERFSLGNFAQDGSRFNSHLTIEPDGHVGIGVKNPCERLDVQGSIHVSDKIRLGDCQLKFLHGKLLLIYSGRKYEIEMHHIHHNPVPPDKKWLMWLLITIAILLLIGIGILIYFLVTSNS